MLRNFSKYLLFAGVSVVVFSCSQKEVPEEEILARVGDEIISITDFENKYKEFKAKSGAEPSGRVRRGLLQSLVDDKVLSLKARNLGLDSDSAAVYEMNKIKTQELLNQFNKKFVTGKVTISENESKKMFHDFNTRLKASHLFAATKERADSLYLQLEKGESFERLASVVFRDPVLKNNGGSLGYFSVGDMDPAFEEVAYALEKDKYSKPVRTKDGYSIIKIESRESTPFLTEFKYSTQKEKIDNYLFERKTKLAVRAFVDSLKDQLNIQFNDPELHKLIAVIKDKSKLNNTNDVEILDKNLNSDENTWLLRFKDNSWNIERLRKAMQLTSEHQQKWIKDLRTFKEFLSGLVVREEILKQARKKKLDKQEDFKENIAQKFDRYLLERISKNLVFELVIPNDSLYNYYQAHVQSFKSPQQVNLREVVMAGQEDAKVFEKKLKAGKSFEQLAKEFSKYNTNVSYNGETGYLSRQKLGKWADLAFSLKENEWTGPFIENNNYVFLQCVDKKDARQQSFNEVKGKIDFAMKSNKWQEFKTNKLNTFKKDFRIETYPEKLRNLALH